MNAGAIAPRARLRHIGINKAEGMMAVLVADLGGTNARLALAEGAVRPDSVARYRGKDYPRFDDVVTDYLAAQGRPEITAVCMAVAGPVRDGAARLTNRDWHLTEAGLSRMTGAEKSLLINDMVALGHAVPGLGTAGRDIVLDAPGAGWNRQALVVNAGTGFNVCPLRLDPATPMEAEEGHTALPATIATLLHERLGDASAFTSTEALFAGPGLARLHKALTGEEASPETIASEGGKTVALMAELFGRLLREMALRFMPGAGIYLAGSLARTLAAWPDEIARGYRQDGIMHEIPASTPVWLMRDELAALSGCLAALR